MRKLKDNYVSEIEPRVDVTVSDKDGESARVCRALALTLRLSRVIGMAPLRLTQMLNGDCIAQVLQDSNFHGYFILFALHACVLSGLIMNTIKEIYPFEFTKRLLEIAFMGFICTVGVFGAHRRMKTIVHSLNVIEKIHPQAMMDRSFRAEDRRRGFALVLCVVVAAVQITCNIMFTNAASARYLTGRVMFLSSFLVCEVCVARLLALQFMCVADCAGAALAHLNHTTHSLLYLIDMQSSPNISVFVAGLPDAKHIPAAWINTVTDTLDITAKKDKGQIKSNLAKMVSRLIINYGQISDVMYLVNDSFEVFLLTLLGAFLFYMVTTVHSLIICLYEPTIEIFNIVTGLLSIAAHLIQMFLTIEPAYRTDLELQRTRLLVTQLLSRAPTCEQAVSFQLDLLYKQAQLNNFSYSPMGICSLSRPLIIDIIGAATIFINILLQYRVLDRHY